MTERASSLDSSTCGAACAPMRIVNAGRLGPPQDQFWSAAGLFVVVALLGAAAIIVLQRQSSAKRASVRVTSLIVAAIVGALFSLMTASGAFSGVGWVTFALAHPGVFDRWLPLVVAALILAMIGVVGIWFALRRKRPFWFLGFALLQVPLALFSLAMNL